MGSLGKFVMQLSVAVILIALPWQWITLFEVVGLNFKPIHAAIASLLLVVMVIPTAIGRIFRFVLDSTFSKLYIAYVITLGVSLLWSQNFGLGLSLLVKKITYFFIFLLMVMFFTYLNSDRKNFRAIPNLLTVALLVFLAYAFIVFGILKRNLIVEYMSAVASGDSSALQFKFYNILFRFTGDQQALASSESVGASLRNTLVGSFLVFMMMAFIFLNTVRSSNIRRILAWGVIGMCIFLIVTSVSRSNVITLALTLGIAVWQGKGLKSFTSVQFYSVMGLVIMGILTGIFYLDVASAVSNIIVERLAGVSESARLDIYEVALLKINANPVFGEGLGSFIEFNDENVQAHNIFLTAWMSAGLLGIGFSVAYYLRIIYDAMQLARHKNKWILPVPMNWSLAFVVLPLFRVLVSGQGDFTLVEWMCMAYFYSIHYLAKYAQPANATVAAKPVAATADN